MEIHDDIILIDWLTATFKVLSVHQVIELVGLSGINVVWRETDSYMNGYPHRLTFEGINILYGAREDMGVCLTMSGQGCRSFESFSSSNWTSLLKYILKYIDDEEANLTRLDLAFDDHSGILDINRILDDTDDGYYSSKSRWWKVEYGSEGTCIYFGSPRSNHRIRIYDKAAERGYIDDTHWIRVEMQMRDNIATQCLREIMDRYHVGEVFCGVLRNYLIFRDPTSDSNKSRWPIADYWQDLLGSIAPISLWVDPGTEYNIFKLQSWLVDQCGAAITCYRDILGLDELMNQIKLKEIRLSPKYERLKAQFTAYKKG